MYAGTRQRHNRGGHTGRAAAVADHYHTGAGTGHVLPVGPYTPPVRVRRRCRAQRFAVAETGRQQRRRRRQLETRRNVVVVGTARGRGQHPEHPVDRLPGADRVAQTRRAPVRDLRQHVERTGVHVRPAGEPEGVQAPAERVHIRHHDGHRGRVRGPGQDRQTALRPQVPEGTGPARHPVPVPVPEPDQHVPPGHVDVVRLVASNQMRAPMAHHRTSDGQEHVHIRVLDVRACVLDVRTVVLGPADILRAEHRHPGTGVAVLQRRRRRGGRKRPAPKAPAGRR